MKRGRSWMNFLGLFLFALCLLANHAVHAASDYIIRSDDKLKIKIFQYPELSGEYIVGANGTISIATIGEIAVGGVSTRDVANRISERFSRAGLSDKLGTSVEILQTRPVYILGDVQKPGEYPFRPGITVLQAVSLAGGWLRFNDPGLMRLERDTINIKGEMRNLVRRYYQLIAHRARLNAELLMKNDVQFSPELERQARADHGLMQLINEERSLLGLRVDAMRSQIESLERARGLYEREIEAVSRQIQANKAQYDSVGKELAEVDDLFERGLTTTARKMGLVRMRAQIEMNEQGFQTLMLRARQNISQVEQKIFDLKSERNASLTAELQKTRLDLDDINIKFETNQSLLVEAQLIVPTMVGTSDGVVEARSLTVVRVQGGNAQTIDAEEHTELLPGDVLRVQRTILPSALDGQKLMPRNIVTSTEVRN